MSKACGCEQNKFLFVYYIYMREKDTITQITGEKWVFLKYIAAIEQ